MVSMSDRVWCLMIYLAGNKLVLKKQRGLRRQFLLLNGSPVLGFIMRKKKFTSCEAYKDVTNTVDCKVGQHILYYIIVL